MLIIEHEMDFHILSYNQLKTVCSYFWDYNIQLYPHVDYVIHAKLDYTTLSIMKELNDPYFWDMYVTADNRHFTLIDVMRIL